MPTQRSGLQRMRTTCDSCYKAKMKCSRGNPCETCARLGHKCCYSPSNRLGRPPKGQAKKGKVSSADDATSQSSQLLDQLTMTKPRDDTKSEDLLTLDDMFMDVFLEPLPGGQTSSHGGDIDVNHATKASLLTLTERASVNYIADSYFPYLLMRKTSLAPVGNAATASSNTVNSYVISKTWTMTTTPSPWM
ncbi:hypothetical protein F4859DRAFT_528786 [Xylaria cf. heliscus]|nr:hypothetical protein F4859DRAFT_528786 [Xylaria cf. heliscus]